MRPPLLRAMFDEAGRVDDRLPAGVGHLATKPPVLRRRAIHAIALFGIVVIFYGTLMPFQIDPTKTLTWQLHWHQPIGGDFITNITLYIPIGAFLCLLFRRRGSSKLIVGVLSLLVASMIAYLTEVSQTILMHRVASWTDAVCNFSGAAIGITLAPFSQRLLRNIHAWLYVALRAEPFAAVAAATTLCIWVYALAPFDVRPTPNQLERALISLQEAQTLLPFGMGAGGDSPLPQRQIVDKVVACGSYGLLAFLLVLASREAGLSLGTSAWHALSRTMVMACAIELMQLLTISHTTDPADLTGGWICSGLGVGLACLVLLFSPQLHRQPRRVLQGLMAIVALVVVMWKVVSLMLTESGDPRAHGCWLPLVNHFYRPWNSLLGDYTTGFLQYTIVGGVLAVWCRSHRRRPTAVVIIGGALTAAVTGLIFTIISYKPIDTGQFLLALVAGMTVMGLDRALWDQKKSATEVAAP